jgi:hypothetical protein
MDVLQRVLKQATVQPWRHTDTETKSNFFQTKKRSQLAPLSHYVTPNQPTNWAVNMTTRLRCILSSLSNSR